MPPPSINQGFTKTIDNEGGIYAKVKTASAKAMYAVWAVNMIIGITNGHYYYPIIDRHYFESSLY
jgi:hypothetical protein